MIDFAPTDLAGHGLSVPIAFRLRGKNDGKVSVRLSLVHPKSPGPKRTRVGRSRVRAVAASSMRAVRRIKGL